jgi:hypothetical protein
LSYCYANSSFFTVQAFRKISIKKLHVKLFLVDHEDYENDDPDDFDDSDDDDNEIEDEEDRLERLENEMAPLIAELLRPTVSRAVEVTDTELSLEARTGILEV